MVFVLFAYLFGRKPILCEGRASSSGSQRSQRVCQAVSGAAKDKIVFFSLVLSLYFFFSYHEKQQIECAGLLGLHLGLWEGCF